MKEPRAWHSSVAFALLAAACSGAPVRPESGATVVAPPADIAVVRAPPEPRLAQTSSADEIVARALVETSRIRELAATGNVRGVALSRAEMAAHVKETMEREVPKDVVASEGEVLVALGVAPPAFDYVQAIVSLMTAELAGYYEPTEKTMYLASDLGDLERAATLSHELVHALQDQHYDLGKLLDYRPDDSDVQGAIHALAEGDATSAMLDEMLAPKGAKATDLSEDLLGLQVRAAAQLSPSQGDVPEILKRSLIAPYVDGIRFVHWLRRRGGWAAVDAAWRDPPKSTEQILHPEKYAAREAPLSIAVPAPPDGFPVPPVYTDVMGEESMELLFEEWLPRVPSTEAASGWGGDRVALFRDVAGQVALGFHLRYDDVASATLGTCALERGIAAQRVAGGDASNLTCVERATVGPLLVASHGRDIAVVAGPYLRGPTGTVSAGTCSLAKVWAARILSQR